MATQKEAAAVEAVEAVLKRVNGNPVLGYLFGDQFSRGFDELEAYVNARRAEKGKEPVEVEAFAGQYLTQELDTRPHGLVLDAWGMITDLLVNDTDTLPEDQRAERMAAIAGDAARALKLLADDGNAKASAALGQLRDTLRGL